ncbi:MAG: Undecaprenyl-phosphate galactose phosphotransferase [Candidatus Brocadiaceae bacterium]|nr:Undecaprenyl-phosphate galactose phosphotransferase [Candidatus Brocadiaceae bacterium]
MLKQHHALFKRIMIVSDICIVSIAFFLGIFLGNDTLSYTSEEVGSYIVLLPTFFIMWGGLFYCLGMYESFRTKQISDILLVIIETTFLGIGFFGSFLFVTKISSISRLQIGYSFFLAALFISIEKIALIKYFHYQRKKGINVRNYLIVGTGKRAQNFINLINEHSEWGINVIGLVDDKSREHTGASYGIERSGPQNRRNGGQARTGTLCGRNILGTLDDIPAILHNNVVDEVLFVIPRSWLDRVSKIISYICDVEGIKVSLAADFFDHKLSKAKHSHLGTLPLITFDSTSDKVMQLLIKRLFDISFSTIVLILLLPVFLISAVVIKITTKGAVIFSQQRSGLNGRRFTLYKFRTMFVNAESQLKELLEHNEMKGPVFKMQNDPRVTNVGKYLRKFSIDELPQFWNVLKGDMSIVGPRPPIPAEVDKYDSWQRRRLCMRPGITCIWQVSGRNNIIDFNEWMNLDLQYIDDWSIWLDFRILLRTIPVVLFGKGAK